MSDRMMNYDRELCRAPSGRYYVETYELPSRTLVHTTHLHANPGDAAVESGDWIKQQARTAAAIAAGAEPLPAA